MRGGSNSTDRSLPVEYRQLKSRSSKFLNQNRQAKKLETIVAKPIKWENSEGKKQSLILNATITSL